MRKLVLLIAVVALFSVVSNAQEMFEKGTQVVKVGLGINGHGIPLEVSYEKGIVNDFLEVKGLVLGVGANLGYYGYKENFGGNLSWKYTNVIVAGRALVHYKFIDQLDTYAGIMLGYNVAKAKYDGVNSGFLQTPTVGGIVYGGLLGARYEFNQNWGAYFELGYSTSFGNLGIAYKF